MSNRSAALGLVLVVALLPTGCDDGARPPDSTSPADEATSSRSASATSPTLPPHDTRERYAALPQVKLWDLFEPDEADLALLDAESVEDLVDAATGVDRTRLLRAGLRLPDGAARWHSARLADWRTLDLDEQWEAARILARGIEAPTQFGLSEDPLVGAYWHVLEHAGAGLVPELLAGAQRTPAERLSLAVVDLIHKYTRVHHMPRIAELVSVGPSDTAEHFAALTASHAEFTDRHPEAFDRIAFRHVGIDTLPAKATGLSPALTARFERKLEFLREADPTAFRNPEDPYPWRRLRDATPDASDAKLLIALLDEGADGTIPLWQFRHFEDDDTLRTLHEAMESEFAEDRAIALAALVVRGEDGAPASLSELAITEPIALALALEVDEVAGRSAFLDALARTELDDLYSHVHATLWEARATFDLDWAASALRPLHDRIVADDPTTLAISAERLAIAAERVPAFWTRTMAETVLRRMPAPDALEAPSDDEYWWQTAVLLEVGAPGAFADWLAAVPLESPARAAARRTLLLLGSPRHGAELVTSITGDERLQSDDDEGVLHHLARSASPEVTRYLESVARGDIAPPADHTPWDAAAALAVVHGLPPAVALSPTRAAQGDDEGELDAELQAAMTALVVAGDPVGAFALQLDAAPDLRWDGAGDVDDPRVERYLRRLESTRHLEHRPWAVAELAISGDTTYQAELYAVIAGGHYRWCDELDSRQSTIGHDLGLLPLWIEFSEASCCQNPTATSVWDDYFGLERDTGGWRFTVADLYTRWWNEWAAVSEGRFQPTYLHWTRHWYPVLR